MNLSSNDIFCKQKKLILRRMINHEKHNFFHYL